ncbi:MAG: M14 family zinc carboxypeptidase [Fimbriimonadales bacterium]
MWTRALFLIISVLVCTLSIWAQRVDYTGYQVLRLKFSHPKQLEQVQALVHDIWTCHLHGNTVDVCASPEERRALAKAGYQWTVLIEDVEALIRQQQTDFLPQGGDLFSRYLTLSEVYEVMRQFADQNPRLVQMLTIGQSVEGRPIYALRLTKDPRRARVYPNRPQVVLNSCQHAREWITVSVALYLAHALVAGYTNDTRIQQLLDRLEVYIVPVVNPDGYEFSWTTNRLWRKNRRYLGTNSSGQPLYGVDLNRNWGYQWGGVGSSNQRSSEIYRGPAPFSEPETYSLSRWMMSLPTLRAHIDIHSYSQLILYPWGFTGELPPFDPVFARVGSAMQSAIQSVYGLFYTVGPIYTTIYPASGGMTDWVFGVRGALSFTYELRDTGQYGFLLPPDQIRPNAEEVYPAVLELLQWTYERNWR